jgi:hypothetical protein
LGIKDRTFRRFWNDGFKWPEFGMARFAQQHRTQKHRAITLASTMKPPSVNA